MENQRNKFSSCKNTLGENLTHWSKWETCCWALTSWWYFCCWWAEQSPQVLMQWQCVSQRLLPRSCSMIDQIFRKKPWGCSKLQGRDIPGFEFGGAWGSLEICLLASWVISRFGLGTGFKDPLRGDPRRSPCQGELTRGAPVRAVFGAPWCCSLCSEGMHRLMSLVWVFLFLLIDQPSSSSWWAARSLPLQYRVQGYTKS